MDPKQLRYAETHEWLYVDDSQGEPIATIGISAYAVEALGDVTHMELPEPGADFSSGDSFGEVESVKAVSDLYTPVELEITEVNTKLPDNLNWLNDSPYDQGWIVKGKLKDPSQVEQMMDFEAYQKLCDEEQH
ncbi:Glycine cleavage system H protein [Planctomycetales bacterium 10988]|nr:Glycine cleavage system H protein [Planctomycetales bacterium 10988]